MSALTFDRFVSGSNWTFDRFVDVSGFPNITSVGTVQEGQPITITGTGFSGSGNTAFLTQGDKTLQLTVNTESTTSIVTLALDASGLYLTQPVAIYVLNNSAVASNSFPANVLPVTGSSAAAITQTFLGDPTSRTSGSPDLDFIDEVILSNVQGGTISDVSMTGQGAIIAAAGVTSVDYQIQDGTGRGAVGTLSRIAPVTSGNVPSIVGLSEMAADALVLAAGLVPAVAAMLPSASIAVGFVAAQFPPAGQSLVLGGTVELTISLGSTVTIVPILTGLSRIDAEFARSASGLIGVTYRYIDGINSGAVLNQSVAPGTLVQVGSAVDIVISSNLCPNVLGLLNVDAEAILTAANLLFDDNLSRAVYDATAPLNTVISQSPAPDTMISPGTTVFLTLSLGPPPVRPGATQRNKRIANTYQ